MSYEYDNRNGRRNTGRGQPPPSWGGWGRGPQQPQRDYPPYPPYQQGGWSGPQPTYDEGPQYAFQIGQMVRHKATGTELSVIRYGREQLECRMPDLSSNWFYPHELEPIVANDPPHEEKK